MIPDNDELIPSFDDPAREREWLAQENAMRRERLHLDPAGDDPRGARYRLIARALREPLPHALPPDFARQLAARVAAAPTHRRGERGFEFALTLALAAALFVAAGTVVAIYGDSWLPAFRSVLPAPSPLARDWLLALAGCLGGTWLLGRWQQHARMDG